jgi:transglutaminase-like putative cysteine protease
MCRPRDSHDLRLLDAALTVRPQPSKIRWQQDPFGNSIAIVDFESAAATELRFESSFRVEHDPAAPAAIEVEPYARNYPFHYASDDMPDLARTVERHYPDPGRKIDAWARRFIGPASTAATSRLLSDMTQAIRSQFHFTRREEMGTQSPTETLERGAGSCRDMAMFMIEAVRSLGFAARFVSGYLYDESLASAAPGTPGPGATHAWVQIYLPGAGWVEYDPTNAAVGSKRLIRVAVARDASQATPLIGSYTGAPADYLGLTVDVRVTKE